MSQRGYDYFFEKPDEFSEIRCRVCSRICRVERSIIGPTGPAEGMSHRGHWYDSFRCPNSGKPWHELALRLVRGIEDTPSLRLAKIIRLDLDELLEEHGCCFFEGLENKTQNIGNDQS